MLRTYATIAAGAALGSICRYLLSLGALGLFGPHFPWGTLAANAAGSFLICLYAASSGQGRPLGISPGRDFFVMAGFCGGFTTFSIFSLETVMMAAYGRAAAATLHVALSLAVWLAAGWSGLALARRLNRR